jgi:hypothetical protein
MKQQEMCGDADMQSISTCRWRTVQVLPVTPHRCAGLQQQAPAVCRLARAYHGALWQPLQGQGMGMTWQVWRAAVTAAAGVLDWRGRPGLCLARRIDRGGPATSCHACHVQE